MRCCAFRNYAFYCSKTNDVAGSEALLGTTLNDFGRKWEPMGVIWSDFCDFGGSETLLGTLLGDFGRK